MTTPIRAILTDIEGTTSSIAFVAETLFPYARAHLPAFVAAHPERVAGLLAEVAAMEPGDPVATLLRWIDEDRKATPLKTLQGWIWAEGYATGAYQGHVYPDAAEALRAWKAAGLRLFVYSSGSVEAQELLFGHSDQGDLTPLFEGYFDTTSGGKREAGSYVRIAAAIGEEAGAVLFLSDVQAELDAAAAAGMRTVLVDRSGGAAGVGSFEEIGVR
ncbi:acireductone synthase [Phenylobacterium montanum]|uniref:Enolase-phosphatase E1 n=1 Tax=Phenylobacterium montanum TaxID=2823693 RepID=A0A975G0R7_9CAUL|nr:acireductone synthase [Caulobacter sp. S6]QUD88362.1 acireductone synthase [Caulobacter sp. S6]